MSKSLDYKRKILLLFSAILILSIYGCAEIEFLVHTTKQIARDNSGVVTQKPHDKGQPVPSGYKVGSAYKISGKWYYPYHDPNYNQTGIASWYGKQFHGRLTANGEVFDMNTVTAAHKTLPLPSIARVTNLSNGRVLLVRVNDRGPFVNERIIDLSRRSAQLLGIYRKGTGKVKVEFIEFASLGNSASIDSAYGSLKDTTNTITKINKKIISDKTISSDKLFIQLGAFSNKENAIKLAGKLETFGSSKITKININGRELHRLRIGPLSSKSEADIILTRLHNNGYPGAKLHSNK